MKFRFKASAREGVMNRQQVWKIVGVILLVCGLQLYGQQTASGAQGTPTTFDVPGAGTGLYQGTFPKGINTAGAIAGYYLDANSVSHGFLRSSGHEEVPATIVTIDDPGAGTCNPPLVPPCYPIPGTFPTGINTAGAITGYYVDANSVSHGFLWVPKPLPNGTFKTIDPPNSGSTQAIGINTAGAITGNYSDTIFGGGPRGFLWVPKPLPNGTFTTFDAPGACQNGPGSCSSNGTQPAAINPAGAITGIYQDINFSLDCYCNPFHGFVRDPKGAFTSFDPPGSSYTQPTGINPVGAITGYSGIQGFLRSPHGAISTIDFPPHQGTFPSAINPAGMITGNYFSNNQYHGFLWRLGYSAPKTFDPPGSTNTTTPTAINSAGAITGYYVDANFVNHGFVRRPPDE
jgi:hypothetical protein